MQNHRPTASRRLLTLLAAPILSTALSLPCQAQPSSPGWTPKQPLQRLAFGSCAHQDKPQPIWDAVLQARPQVFALLGDNVYGDTLDMKALQDKYRRFAAKPGFQKLRRQSQVIATWDDHDYGQNDAGAEFPQKQASRQIFLDFFKEPAQSPRRKRPGIYTSYLYGPPAKRVQVILLDLRTFRSPLQTRPMTQAMQARHMGPYTPTSDKAATLMGEDQWRWLEAQLRQPARVRLIGTSIPILSQGSGWETWENMPQERERMFALIQKTRAAGVLFLTGDTHWAELSTERRPGLYPLHELTSSGLTEVWRGVAPNARRVGQPFLGANFGLVTIDWNTPDPSILLAVHDQQGTAKISLALKLSQLTGFPPSEPSRP